MLVYMLYTSGIERVAVPVQKPNPGRYLACLGGIRRKSWLGGWRLRVRGRLEGSSVAKYIDKLFLEKRIAGFLCLLQGSWIGLYISGCDDL